METILLPTPGRRFYHRRFIDSDLNPSLCQITRLAQGMVYYAILDSAKPDPANPLKGTTRAELQHFLHQSLGYWEDDALPRSERARGLRRWAARNSIREVLPLSDRARLVAEWLHAKDQDKAGRPYMEHVQAVADGVRGEDAKVVAYLHDTKEDHGLPDLDYEWLGFESRHITGLAAVTRLAQEKGATGYHDFVARAAQDPLGRAVKRSDLRNNAIIERIPAAMRTPHDLTRAERYRREIAFLEALPPLEIPQLALSPEI